MAMTIFLPVGAVVFATIAIADVNAFSVSGRYPARTGVWRSTEQRASIGPSSGEGALENVVIIGAGWGGLSAAHALATSSQASRLNVTVVDAAPRCGGLVRDGFSTINGTGKAEAGQHGFWDSYANIFKLLEDLPTLDTDDVLTGYDEQGQYSPRGLEAVWPVYRDARPPLPTGLAQAAYTRFDRLPVLDRATAAPLALALAEFDDSSAAWEKYDEVSFRDLCVKLGVSQKMYDEAFEPMILTGLFAPGAECSAAAALGMAYFFVLANQNAFDVRWCKGNIGDMILEPWTDHLKELGVHFQLSTQVRGFDTDSTDSSVSTIRCVASNDNETRPLTLDTDKLIFAVGGAALNRFASNSPELAKHAEFRRFANLRGTGVLATRLYLDTTISTAYSANACWGFDEAVGMTLFDITRLHNLDQKEEGLRGSVIEIDYYHAASLLCMSDEEIVNKAKRDLDAIVGTQAKGAQVLDAAVVRLPSAVNWYSPGSYKHMPEAKSTSMSNVYFCGDIVRSRHGSWSQEKAYVTGIEAANLVLGRSQGEGIIPIPADEPHVALGRKSVAAAKSLLGFGEARRAPSLVDFLW